MSANNFICNSKLFQSILKGITYRNLQMEANAAHKREHNRQYQITVIHQLIKLWLELQAACLKISILLGNRNLYVYPKCILNVVRQ